jgi:(4-alkanoyl-5-oxo-2,5-dihydrofuran-3-yl)methyl phosphate reductase
MILVVGATGTVGRPLVDQLLAMGHNVRVFTRDSAKVAYLGDRVERAVGDLEQPDTIAAAVTGVDRMFLLTLGFGPAQDTNAVRAAKDAGVRHVVKLSTLEAANPTLTVGRWHREREDIIRASGLTWTFLRPGMFMSNALQWTEMIERGGVYFPGGQGKVAPIDPYDVATVAALALTEPGHENQAYELTGPQLLSIGEMTQTLARVLDRPLRYVSVPSFAARIVLRRSGMDKRLVAALLEGAAALRAGKGAVLTDTFKHLVGRDPRTFEEWAREHASDFR